MTAISVEHLVKTYNGVNAVNDISFEVAEGEVFGMLGPNGAGKTTTVEIIEGLRPPDGGQVKVLNLDITHKAQTIREHIGVALQTTTLMPNLTSWELLDLFGTFYSRSVAPDIILDRLNLGDKRNARVQTLSGGQQQRLSVALALVNDPQIVFLDEPTTGLDPQARRSLWDVVEQMRSEGKTVFLTTHYMEEAERLCDRVAIMDHGKILALDTPKGLIRSQFSDRAIQFQLLTGPDPSAFENFPGVNRVSTEDGEIVLHTDRVQETLGRVLEQASAHNWELGEIRLRDATLEDVFLKMTGRKIRS